MGAVVSCVGLPTRLILERHQDMLTAIADQVRLPGDRFVLPSINTSPTIVSL